MNWIPFRRNEPRIRGTGVCLTRLATNEYSLVIHSSGGQLKLSEKCDVGIGFSEPMFSLCGALLLCYTTCYPGSAQTTPNLYTLNVLKILISISWSINYTEAVYHKH